MFSRALVFAASMILSTQAFASAFDSLDDQKLQGEAYSLLVKNADSIRLTGDVHSHERLSTIIDKVEAYYRELEEVLMAGGDIETDMKSNISHVDTQCKVAEGSQSAKCDLTIAYIPLGETTVRFTVTLDETKTPVAVDAMAEVFRGD